jgi:hypothetical protein
MDGASACAAAGVKKPRLTIRFKFADGDVSIPLADALKRSLEQAAAAAASSEPSLRMLGQRHIDQVAQRLVERLLAIVVRERATEKAAEKRKEIGAATKARVAELKPGADPAVSDRHLRRLKKPK